MGFRANRETTRYHLNGALVTGLVVRPRRVQPAYKRMRGYFRHEASIYTEAAGAEVELA
jgi:hypothetical protein